MSGWVRFTIAFFLTCIFNQVLSQNTAKIKGLSFDGTQHRIEAADIPPVLEINANWVTLMPFGFIRNKEISYNQSWQWWGEREEGIKEAIKAFQKSGIKIMLKPQVWIPNGYTGDFELEEEAEWQKFETSYQSFIAFFASIAVEMEVDLFCIGTEWGSFIKKRPDFWDKLIATTRTTFNGKITYASNWDDYQQVHFWSELDYIGVNAYFPISIRKNPSQDELMRGWEMHREHLSKFAKKQKQSILFTEVGYRSMKGATIKPWEHQDKNSFSEAVQERAYIALFEQVWEEDWFAGMFIWKWYPTTSNKGGKGDIDFTPQHKLAEKTIRKYWQK